MPWRKPQVREPRRVANLSDASLMRREQLRQQIEANTQQFQREREAQQDCHLGWDFYYNFNESSLGLPYESQLALVYVHRNFAAQGDGASDLDDVIGGGSNGGGSGAGAKKRKINNSTSKFHKNNQSPHRQQHPPIHFGRRRDSTSSDDEQPVEQLDSGATARLTACYGGHVQWDLHFKDPAELKKSIIKLNVIVASALMDPQLNVDNLAALDTAVASIDTLTLSLAEDINKLLRKCRMMYQSYDEESHPSRSSLITAALAAICEFLGISRLSFIGPMLQPNPAYRKPKGASMRTTTGYPKTTAHSLAVASVNLPGGINSSSAGMASPALPQASVLSMPAALRTSTALFSAGSSQKVTTFNLENDQQSSSSELELHDLGRCQINCPYLKMTESTVDVVRIFDKFDDRHVTSFSTIRSRIASCCFPFVRMCLRRWDLGKEPACGKRWLFVADTFLGIMNIHSKVIEEIMLFDTSFVVRWSKRASVTSFTVSNRHLEVTLDCETPLKRRVLVNTIRTQTSGVGRPGRLFTEEAVDFRGRDRGPAWRNSVSHHPHRQLQQHQQSLHVEKEEDDENVALIGSLLRGVSEASRSQRDSKRKSATVVVGKTATTEDDDDDDDDDDDIDDEDDDEDDRASIQSADSVLSTNIDATERNSAVDNDSDKTTNDTELQSERPTSLSSLLVHQKSLGKSEAYPSSDGSGGSEDDLSSNDGDAKKSGPVEVNGEFGLSGSQKKRSVRPRHSRRNLLRLQRRLKRKQKRRARKRRQAALAAAAAAVASPREGRRRIGTRDSTLTAAGVDVEEDEDDPYTAGVSSRMRLTHRLDRQWRGQASAARSHTWRRPFGSFAPSRSGVKAQWYLDGGAYMYAVADAIDSAATEIWICANRLSPEVHLRRPDATGQHQLGSALMHKAKSGVRVCLLLDNPTCMAGVNFALHVVDYFEGTPNVHVLLHPTDPSTGCFALAKDCWSVLRAALVARKRLYSACFNGYCGKRSEVDKRPCHCCFPSQKHGTQSRTEQLHFCHNEKLVVVDQKVALLSAVDLTWGVWDTSYHVINDVPTALHSVSADSRIKRPDVRMQDIVENYWARPQFQYEVLGPEVMSSSFDLMTQQRQSTLQEASVPTTVNAAGDILHFGRTVFLQGHLRDLQRPPDSLGCVTDYDKFSAEPSTRMTKPFSPFLDVNDPTLDTKYLEVTRLLDQRFSSTMRSELVQEAHRVVVPALRVMSRPDALGRSLAEPAHVDQLFSGSAFSADPVDQNRPKAEPTGGSSGSGGAGSGGGGGGGGTTDGSTIVSQHGGSTITAMTSIGVAAGRGRSGMDNPARRDWRREFDELCSMQNTLQQKQQRRRAEEKKVSGGLRGPKNLGPNEQNSKPIFSNASTGDNKDRRSRIDAGFRETEDDNSSTMAEMDNGHSATYMNNNSNLATQEFTIDEEADAEAGLEDSFGGVSEVEATETRASSMVGKRFKDNVCVADCMRLQSLSCKDYADLSDDSDSSDPDEAPSDLLLRLKRRLVLSRAKSRVRNAGLSLFSSTRADIERRLSSLRHKLRTGKDGRTCSANQRLLQQQQQQQQQQHQMLEFQQQKNQLGATSRSILLEHVESAASSLPKLRRHYAMREDGTRFTTRLFPGLDYWNPHLMPLTQAHATDPCNPPNHLDPTRHPRLPVHSVGIALFGCGARDAARHFVERWNFARHDAVRMVRKVYSVCTSYEQATKLLNLPLLAPRCYANHDLDDIETRVGRRTYLHPLSDLPVYTDSDNLSSAKTKINFLFLNLGERSGAGVGDTVGDEDEDTTGLRRLVSAEAAARQQQLLLPPQQQQQQQHFRRQEGKKSELLVEDEEFVNCMERLGQGRALHTCQVSMLRSLGRWSGGTSRYAEENSVLLAYYSAIAQAQRFVYIENELFISQGRNRPTDVTVKNRISFYLYKRILQARSRGEPFKVYIVIPLFPRHDGQLLSGSRGDYTSRKQMHFLYQTIFRGEDSLTHRLLQRHIAPHEYLSVCCLQKFDRLPDGWLAQEIYVQSNLLIADDRVAIIGSARIADHSLLGWRNSELAVRVEDVGFVRSLRMALWCEHLDVPPAEKEALISDPGDAAVWNLWCAQARSNSQIMQEVFRSLPNNAAYTMARLHDFAAISYLKRRAKLYAPDRDTMAQGLERLCQVKGQIVVCSGCFMEGSQLLKVQDKDQSWRSWFFWPDFALV